MQDEQNYDENGCHELCLLALDDLTDDPQRVIIRIDPEQPEDPYYSEHSEHCCSGRKEYRQVVRQE